MNEIVIGNGDKGCTAIKVFSIEGAHGISENKVSYWIWPCLFDMNMVIFKDTKEGEKLKSMIDSHTATVEILKWVDWTLLRRIEPGILLGKIEQSNKKWFEAGKKAKAQGVRDVLEIRGSGGWS